MKVSIRLGWWYSIFLLGCVVSSLGQAMLPDADSRNSGPPDSIARMTLKMAAAEGTPPFASSGLVIRVFVNETNFYDVAAEGATTHTANGDYIYRRVSSDTGVLEIALNGLQVRVKLAFQDAYTGEYTATIHSKLGGVQTGLFRLLPPEPEIHIPSELTGKVLKIESGPRKQTGVGPPNRSYYFKSADSLNIIEEDGRPGNGGMQWVYQYKVVSSKVADLYFSGQSPGLSAIDFHYRLKFSEDRSGEFSGDNWGTFQLVSPTGADTVQQEMPKTFKIIKTLITNECWYPPSIEALAKMKHANTPTKSSVGVAVANTGDLFFGLHVSIGAIDHWVKAALVNASEVDRFKTALGHVSTSSIDVGERRDLDTLEHCRLEIFRDQKTTYLVVTVLSEPLFQPAEFKQETMDTYQMYTRAEVDGLLNMLRSLAVKEDQSAAPSKKLRIMDLFHRHNAD